MPTPTYITANDLDRWAVRDQAARSYLPELVSRLIVATVPREDLLSYSFVSGVEVHRPGFDGTVVTAKGTEFVPEGLSYWETGVSPPEGKANEDYNKRVKQHQDRLKEGKTDDFSRATFVALSARDWHEPQPPVKMPVPL